MSPGDAHRLCSAEFASPAAPVLDFGVGAVARVPAHLAGARRAFVVTDPGLRDAGVAGRLLDPLAVARVRVSVFDGVPPNPTTWVAEEAASRLRAFGRDAVVIALGGGSSVDTAKAIALLAANPGARADGSGAAVTEPGYPLIAVPTTSGTGAETNGFGVLEDRTARRKVYCGDDSVLPRVAVLDPELTTGLPPGPTAATGVDALVHGVESLTSRGRNPLSELYAARAVELAGRWLRAAVADGSDLEARSAMLLAAHLAGLALTRSGLGLVHGLGHAISLHCGAPHGLALAAVLAETVRFGLPAEPDGYGSVAGALGLRGPDELPDALRELTGRVGAAVTVSGLGCEDGQRASLAHTALADPVTRNTPRLPTEDELTELVDRCW